MFAAIPALNPSLPPCVIRSIAKTTSIIPQINASAYCGRTANAAAGVMQLPDGVKVCAACETQIEALKKALGG